MADKKNANDTIDFGYKPDKKSYDIIIKTKLKDTKKKTESPPKKK